jgi:hypothetical protein
MGITHFSGIALNGQGGGDSVGLLGGVGTTADPATTATANSNFMDYRLQSSATSGDARGEYLRLYLTGAGGGGEALRAFTTVNNVVGANAHGAHISLNFGASGSLTGQGIAVRGTLHMPTTALPAGNVTYGAVQAEIFSDGSNSDPAGNLLSFFRAVNAGDATGGADVDDDVALFDISGVTIGAGNLVEASTTEANYSNSVRVRINGTNYYMMLASVAG